MLRETEDDEFAAQLAAGGVPSRNNDPVRS